MPAVPAVLCVCVFFFFFFFFSEVVEISRPKILPFNTCRPYSALCLKKFTCAHVFLQSVCLVMRMLFCCLLVLQCSVNAKNLQSKHNTSCLFVWKPSWIFSAKNKLFIRVVLAGKNRKIFLVSS